MNICAIPTAMIEDTWWQFEPGLQTLLDNHTFRIWNTDDVKQKLVSGDWQLFVVADEGEVLACLTCNIVEGAMRSFEIGMCWGRAADDWSGDIIATCDQVAQEMGCDQLILDGRPGWRKIMASNGFKAKSVRYVRAVNG